MKRITLAFILTLLILQGYGQGLVSAQFGKGVTFTAADSSLSIRMRARFQTLFSAEKTLTKGSPIAKDMLIRRARLKFEGFAFTPRLAYKIELGLSNRDNGKIIPQGNNAANIILDAFFVYKLSKSISLIGGQFKLPGNRERQISSQALQFVDRSIVNSSYTIDRDRGIMLSHSFKVGKVVFNDMYALAMGEGKNITEKDTKGFSYSTRLEALPFGRFINRGDFVAADIFREQTPKLSVAVGGSYNNNALRDRGELGNFISSPTDVATLFSDLLFKYRGLCVMSEYMFKEAKNTVVDSIQYFKTGSGFTASAGYLFKNNWEIAGRFTRTKPAKEIYQRTFLDNKGKRIAEKAVKEYTLGVSKYISGHNLKIQSDVSYISYTMYHLPDPKPKIRFRLQMELAL